jgi:hypothetical protein
MSSKHTGFRHLYLCVHQLHVSFFFLSKGLCAGIRYNHAAGPPASLPIHECQLLLLLLFQKGYVIWYYIYIYIPSGHISRSYIVLLIFGCCCCRVCVLDLF